jgi:threonine synthase
VVAAGRGFVGPSDRVVLLATGSGLKDVASAMKAVAAVGTEPMRVDPNLEALKAALEN